MPEVRDFEPSIALTDNSNGLSFYEKFAVFPQKRLDFLTPRAHTGLWYTKYDHRRTTTGAPAPKL